MSHRTYGATRNCAGCRYWSEMIAHAAEGIIKAVCLTPNGTLNQQYTSKSMTCEAWQSGHHGAIDEPPDNGEKVRALYAEEDSADDQ